MDWKSAEKKDDGALVIPERWLHLHYYEALNILFRTENSLRIFVYIILKNELGEEWDSAEIPNYGKTITISKAAEKKISIAKEMGYLGYEIPNPLMHLNSGQLIHLIFSPKYWDIFERHFKGKKEIMQTKLEEIGTVRNSLAHFRPLKNDDIELIKQNIKHAFLGIEECLKEITSVSNIVPTNTNDEWYKSLSKLSTGPCVTQLYQSKREEWVRMEITYNCTILEKGERWSGYYSYKILNLLSPAIVRLGEYSELAKRCTYIMEHIPYAQMQGNFEPEFRKEISLIFSKSVLEQHHITIKTALQKLLENIQKESDLIKEDNLARGSLIESTETRASYNKDKNDETKGWWHVRTDSLACPFGESDPAEYWGDLGLLYQSDFIAGSTRYPWMPSDVSKDEFPF